MNPLRFPVFQAHPLPMTASFIRLVIPPKVIGAYILYHERRDGAHVIYAGRSDTDLRRRLLDHPVRTADTFVPIPCSCPREAYLAELFLYRLLNPIFNNLTPASNN
jgi:hypothetical protein